MTKNPPPAPRQLAHLAWMLALLLPPAWFAPRLVLVSFFGMLVDADHPVEHLDRTLWLTGAVLLGCVLVLSVGTGVAAVRRMWITLAALWPAAALAAAGSLAPLFLGR
ncbi:MULTISPECIES: hypothetical protein [Kitasatospora]|uniref:Uncharacterized protein n=1 Tax=Kitasatospora setae (strain ATCC 33774 / DSM 43861 / JCM 3304 / KCC A-0304 / NBRC 14216 / KM-6054) TaxID=452652 RepID=E4NCJ0_KITSK|nr:MULTISPECIES: hypothetical protein [Kitasatospora]BAJ28921.1 hypothetical protein KSE_31110 [Kitasatospora setae KM-6054]